MDSHTIYVHDHFHTLHSHIPQITTGVLLYYVHVTCAFVHLLFLNQRACLYNWSKPTSLTFDDCDNCPCQERITLLPMQRVGRNYAMSCNSCVLEL